MLIDARKLTADETINCDICIVGAGAAGITLAYELCDTGMEVVLLESGGMKFEDNTQDLNKGDVNLKVHGPLEEYRRRQFGGATTAWGGRCVPFDEIDFETRSYVPHSGWPITKRDLDPYYARAHVYCDIGAYTYDVKEVFSDHNSQQSMIPGLKSEEIELNKLYRFSPPTNFGKKYIDKLKKSRNIKIFLYANCLKIITDDEGNNVSHLKVGTLLKNECYFYAKQYILALGGLEVTRLLLLSNDVHSQGIGNHSNLLGRFYMCHFAHYAEVQFTSQDVLIGYEKTSEGVYCQRAITVNEEIQRQQQLLNMRAFMERPNPSDPSHNNGTLSGTYLALSLFNKKIPDHNLLAHLKNIVFDFNDVLIFSQKWIAQKKFGKRKLPAVIFKNNGNIYNLRIDTEQVPNPDSRVTLSDNLDSFGLNRLKVDWQYTDLDVQNMSKTTKLIEQALINSGVGKIRVLPNSNLKALKGHHIGTTRMASTPNSGVVDENCKVYGLNNLYIASSSVFPTSSYANPTLTLLAITLRLADHIKSFYR
ncbi:GMC family oxidoreductase [Tolypothrix sp. FACHB-123]|uniref:GMC oxidoreductase n=1 Tax=Tolypothrix sp. FACHB-123 TaxID=2692868 RepID=UPI0016873503|nr:GMC oxidoreductase [Tolypothrix sp. FACHB-123]MBD2359406.1 GMC family oxidoreductase [Tolypothrix sp. FACHB-123]